MGELIAKNSSVVAITNSLTTLLDWVNVELFSGFTIIVENAGGGSGHDILDVQIDTSVDGGVTILTDQHAGVPAVPIISGKSSTAAFTETAAYVRVRAKCDTNKDTTAKAYLLADSAAARLCTLDDVKSRLGITKTDDDTVIGSIIAGMESIFNIFTSRLLLQNSADATEYYTGRGMYLHLKRYPIISLTSVKEALDYDFTSAIALTVNSEYRLINSGKNGIIYRVCSAWPDLPDCIEVKYRGGYCAAGATPASGEIALPADIREAAILQVCLFFKRKDDIGLSSMGAQGGSANKFTDMELLPIVKQLLDNYRRPSL